MTIDEVKSPEIGDVTPKPEDFLKIWKRHAADMRRIEFMLQPAADTIRERFLKNCTYSSVLWGQTELSTRDEINYNLILSIEYYWPRAGEDDEAAYTLPLAVALAGPKAINDFYDEEKRKEVEAAKRQGVARAIKEAGDRRILYEKLKKEFETDGTQGKEVKEDKAEAPYPGGIVPV